ncbi:MerR family transcriptional regulator [Enterococcus sp. BWT-B8]|uniref:MerR family transcriptional regulator n=1 Tax=Enterococcus sp. BWT-B8 TaxID=2885157 RepID=UPI001E5D7AA5|nr:MerR family transcriptional regulator [Enterococcus sp. BWT-B8]MCB5951892.1 MerR family transcriptional regulator [Enterococcus sp. BWT-B8]
MEYTINKLALLSGVSTRTLRYYDEIDLLKPARVNSSGYRIYGKKEVDRLQQILFYRSLDMKLEAIKNSLDKPDFDFETALEKHYQELLKKRDQIDLLLLTVEKTLHYHKGDIQMKDTEKFNAFKQQKLVENEEKYGEEIREKYGKETVEASNKKWENMSEEAFQAMNALEDQLFDALAELSETKDLDSETAETVYTLHKKWLSYSWANYSAEAHCGLADTYLADERFAEYYNKRGGAETTELLSQAIKKYAK